MDKIIKIDDIDGVTTATQRIHFTYEGINYTMDVSEDNFNAYHKTMAFYVEHARVPKYTRIRNDPKNDQIRKWANQNGMTIAERGRIPTAIIHAYNHAQIQEGF